jgi:hypothetical protein
MYRQGTVTVCDIFDNPPMLKIRFRTGAASRCNSGSTKMMRLIAALALQNFL